MRPAVGLLVFISLSPTVGAADWPRSPAPVEWHYRWGDSAVDANDAPAWSKATAADGWQQLRAWGEWGAEPKRDPLWLRAVLPAALPDAAALLLESAPDRLEIYIGGQRVYADGAAGWWDAWQSDSGKHLIVRLPADAGGKPLVMRAWDRDALRLRLSRPALGSAEDLRSKYLARNAGYALLGAVDMVVALIALAAVSIIRRPALLAFAILAAGFGWLSLVQAGAFCLVLDWPVLGAAGDRLGLLMLGLALPVVLVELVPDAKVSRVLMHLARTHAGVLIATVFLYVTRITHPTYLMAGNLCLLAGSHLVIAGVLAGSLRRGGRRSATGPVLGGMALGLGVFAAVAAGRLLDLTALYRILPLAFAVFLAALGVTAARRIRAAVDAEGAGEAVRYSEARFRALSQNAADTVFLVDAAGRYLFASPACVAATGFAPEDLYGTTLFDRVHHDDAAKVRQRFRDLLERPGDVEAFEYRNGHADGTWRAFEVRASNQLAHPDVQGLVMNVRDITPRRAAEEKQEALEAERAALLDRFRLMLENMPVACMLKDAEFRFTYWNPAAEKLFGYRFEEVRGRQPFGITIPEVDQEMVEKIFRKLSESLGPVIGRGENRTKDGRTIVCEWTNVPLRDAAGKFIGFLSMCREATDEARTDPQHQAASPAPTAPWR